MFIFGWGNTGGKVTISEKCSRSNQELSSLSSQEGRVWGLPWGIAGPPTKKFRHTETNMELDKVTLSCCPQGAPWPFRLDYDTSPCQDLAHEFLLATEFTSPSWGQAGFSPRLEALPPASPRWRSVFRGGASGGPNRGSCRGCLIPFSPPGRLTRESMGLTPMVFFLGFPDFQFMDSHNGLPRSFGLILTGFCGCQSEVQVCKYSENDFFAGPEQSTFKWHSAFGAGSGPLCGVSPQNFLRRSTDVL